MERTTRSGFGTFTLRDLFWLTIVVALALGWWQQGRSFSQEIENREYRVNFLMEYMFKHGFTTDVQKDGAMRITPPNSLPNNSPSNSFSPSGS